MEENNKSLIIAERIKLKFVSEIIGFVILIILMLGFLGLSIYLESTISITLCAILIIALIVYGIIHLRNIYIYNHSSSILIKFKDDIFTICDDIKPITFTKEDLIDMDYKNKKFYFCTPDFWASGEYNYGHITLYLKNDNSTEECYKLTIKNVANPDKVFEKISHILEWDKTDE